MYEGLVSFNGKVTKYLDRDAEKQQCGKASSRASFTSSVIHWKVLQ